MAANFTLALTGNNQLTDKLFSEDFDISRKFEYEFADFTSVDGFITLPISKINPISKILADSNGPLQIQINYGVEQDSTYSSGVIFYNISPNYGSEVSGIAIATNSLSPIEGFITIIQNSLESTEE